MEECRPGRTVDVICKAGRLLRLLLHRRRHVAVEVGEQRGIRMAEGVHRDRRRNPLDQGEPNSNAPIFPAASPCMVGVTWL